MTVWAILDTAPVRNTIECDDRQIDLPSLRQAKPAIRASIAGSAMVELFEQLVDGRMDFSLRAANVGSFDGVLDEEFLIFPSGRQLTAFTAVEQILLRPIAFVSP